MADHGAAQFGKGLGQGALRPKVWSLHPIGGANGVTSGAGLLLKHLPSARWIAMWDRAARGILPHERVQVPQLVTLKLRPGNAFALGGLTHARGVIPKGFGPLHGPGQIAGRRQVGPNSPAHPVHGMATNAAFAGKELVPVGRITGIIHVAGHVKVGEQLGHVVVTQSGVGNPV